MIRRVGIYRVDALVSHDDGRQVCPFCGTEVDQLYALNGTAVHDWRCKTCFVLNGMDKGLITLPTKGVMPEGWEVPPGCGHGFEQGVTSFGLGTFCRTCAGRLEERDFLLRLAEQRPRWHAAVIGGVDCYIACGDDKNQAECWVCHRTITIWVAFDLADLCLCTGCVDQAVDLARRLQLAIECSAGASAMVAE